VAVAPSTSSGQNQRVTPGAAPSARATSRGGIALDCAFLVVVIGISLLPYIHGLGFYYDDYSVLGQMNVAPNQSLTGLYDAVRPATGERPLQALIFAMLYRSFGLHPFGYHAVNACLLAGVAILLYLVLRELRLPRLLCVTVPLVYSALPHYATNRFWLNAFEINLSSLFYVVSLYAALRALRARPLPLVAWLVVAAACVAGSLFAYEVVFPLFGLNVALLWWAGRRARPTVRTARWITIGGVSATILAVGVLKTTLVAEHGQNTYRIGVQDGLAHHLAYLVSGSIKVNVGTYFLAVPYVVWWIVRHRLTATDAGAAVAAGLLALIYVRWIGRSEREALAFTRHWRNSMKAGVVAFVLGYAIFLTNQRVLFRSAGIDNRVNAAAALGVAAAVAGGLGWIATKLPDRRRVAFLSATVGCVVALGVLMIDSLGGFWTTAAKQQHSIVTSLRRTQPAFPTASTVVLDGVCPEAGPAVVFADEWDFRNAIQLAYGDPSLIGDTATEGLQADAEHLTLTMTFLGRRFTRMYDYGPRLFVYDFPRRSLYLIRDRNDAVRYVSSRPPLQCAPQRSFAWGFDPFRRTSLP
jgi:hypothetical protein